MKNPYIVPRISKRKRKGAHIIFNGRGLPVLEEQPIFKPKYCLLRESISKVLTSKDEIVEFLKPSWRND